MKPIVALFLIAACLIAAGEYTTHKDSKQPLYSSDSTADTMFIKDTFDIGPVYGYKTCQGIIHARGPIGPYAGMGNEDSVIMQLWSVGYGITRVLAADTIDAGFPCSLLFTIPQVTGDSALRENLQFYLEFVDTLSDTTVTGKYAVDWNIKLK